MSGIRVVFVEDDATLSKVLSRELKSAGFEVRALPSAEGVPETVREFRPQVALLDLKLPGRSGMDLLRELRETEPELQFVLLTGHGGVPEAVEAMRLGAYDFLTKPTRLDVLEQTLRRAAEKSDLLVENALLRRAALARDDPYEILGDSPAMNDVRRLIARLGPVEASVLILGENGTGKELIARNLHRQSGRSDRPCVVINCAAIPGEIVESELFGHERGAFTGADRKQIGLFEAAHRGTVFLDEIGELPQAIQPSLLRVLQFGEIRSVGSTLTRNVDVRVIAATNRDLNEDVRTGRFREDLFYRLSTFQVPVPPLREHPEDIPVLARAFLATASARTGRQLALDASALERLAAHDWPGNVRELQSAIVRMSVLAPGDVLTDRDVDAFALDPAAAAGTTARPELPTLRLEQLERLATIAALERSGGNRAAAAAELGISLRTLYNKLKDLGV